MRLSREEFEKLVAQALADLPGEFAEKLENVEVVVEDHPTEAHYGARRLPPGMLLLGLYQGVPLTNRSTFAPFHFPDRITIFQRTIEYVADSHEEVVAQVRRTVLHEIAHHFGMPDSRLRELGY